MSKQAIINLPINGFNITAILHVCQLYNLLLYLAKTTELIYSSVLLLHKWHAMFMWTSINSCNLSKMNCKKTFWRLQVSNNEFTGIKIYVFNLIKISSYVSYLVSSPHSEAFHHCKYGCTKKNKKIQMDTQHIPGFTSATLIFYLHLLMVCRTVICIRRN